MAGCSMGSSDGAESLGGVGGGGGNGGGNNNPPPSGPTPTPVQGLEAMVAWGDASGPVAGYSVMVSRNGSAFQLERETPIARVLLSGSAGEVVRIQVAAFDAAGNAGPTSEPSHPLIFTAVATSALQASAAEPSSSDASSDGSARSISVASSVVSDPEPAANQGDAEPMGPRAPADFDGDGAADLVWESPGTAVVRISSVDLGSARLYTLPTPDARLVAVADFDADGLSDLLFLAAGELAVARGAALPAGAGELTLEGWGQPGAGSEVVATGDFDADGSADAVVTSAGGAALWLASGDVLTLPVQGDASIVSAGDGDGDGSDDLIVADAQGFSLWRVVDGSVVSATSLPVPAGSTLLGVTDFDADGADELALRTAPQAIAVQRAHSPFAAWLESAPSGASLAGCDDYDRDGLPDRLWASDDALRIMGSSASEQVVGLDPASPWRLFDACR